MTFDQFLAFNCIISCTLSSRLFLYIFVSASVVIFFLYTNSFEEFKISGTLLGVTFKSKYFWRFLKLIPFFEASRSSLRWVVGLSFGGRPLNFVGTIRFSILQKVAYHFLKPLYSPSTNQKQESFVTIYDWAFSIHDKAHLHPLVKML